MKREDHGMEKDAATRGVVNFIEAFGWQAKAHELGHVLSLPVNDITNIKKACGGKRHSKPKNFAELFSLWHGRAPEDAEWPIPRRVGARTDYEWQAPEVAFLCGLVGTLDIKNIVKALSARLQVVTGDPQAQRSKNSVQIKINKIGLMSTDVLGGLTIKAAAAEIDSHAIVQAAITSGSLKARRVGRLWVIPHADWNKWKSARILAPTGFVRLASIKQALGISSDKLPEFANQGYIPTAIRCNSNGGPSTKFGTWWISKETADQLIADRHQGKPMPWHGKVIKENLDASYKLWKERKHPKTCPTCQGIWAELGAPANRKEFEERYLGLARGAKKHLTMRWSLGVTISELTKDPHCPRTRGEIRQAIANGVLMVTRIKGLDYITKSDLSRWKVQKYPLGDAMRSWVRLETAASLYGFTLQELEQLVASKKLSTRIGTDGAMRGLIYVPKQMCRQLRETMGFSEADAAKRVGLTLEQFRAVLEGVNWRKSEGITLSTLQAVIKRIQSKEGLTLEEAAVAVGQPLQWVIDRKLDGTITVLTTSWDRQRQYIRPPMLERLRQYLASPPPPPKSGADWMLQTRAAREAGVTGSTLIKWAEAKDVLRQNVNNIWLYNRQSVRKRARAYWLTSPSRRGRAQPPEWLRLEMKAAVSLN